jgi:cellobiose transport system permease protein
MGTPDWLGSPWLIRLLIALMISWRYVGYYMILYLTGLQKIPEDLYEAARIDGANSRQIFTHITMPMMRPIILFVVIQATIGGIQVFTEPQLLLGAGSTPEDGGMSIAFYMYNTAFVNKNYGYAAAISWFVAVLIVVFTALNSAITQYSGRSKSKHTQEALMDKKDEPVEGVENHG